jgi:hypothetical protein
MKIPPKLVCVHWTDAFDSSNGWITIKEYTPKATHVISVGYLLEDNLTGHITITGSWFPSDEDEITECGMITHIPKGMVNIVLELTAPNFSSLDLSAYGETHPSQPPLTTPLSPALDYPPYEAKVPHATNRP